MASRLDIESLQAVLASHWKPYLENLHVCMTDATCYESHMRFPTDMKLLWESLEWLYRHICKHCGELGIRRPRNKYDEVKKAGLENFKRDTLWVAVLDTIFPKGFNADSMRYVPYGGGAQFEMAIRNDTAKSGAPFCLLEVKTPYETYLGGLDKQEIANMKDVQTKLGKYCGLMIGSLETANNNAGNWE